ncbi:MAG: hypothetical protein ACRDZ8_09500 [Acidimicrobiales bacterium]
MTSPVVECVANVSEGRQAAVIERLAAACRGLLLDTHSDRDHNRSVFTLLGPAGALLDAVRALAVEAVGSLDLRAHSGVHPRIGVLDVVPFVSLRGWPVSDGEPGVAVATRNAFAAWAGTELALPCFLYGGTDGPSLPDVRRHGWQTVAPSYGPPLPHPTAGAAAVGARPLLVAYNLWLEGSDLEFARQLAASLRGPAVRALGMAVGEGVQVSCNLIDPLQVGPAAAFDAVASRTGVERAELVGLLPARVLDAIPSRRWPELGLDRSRTIEARLEQAGLDGGS